MLTFEDNWSPLFWLLSPSLISIVLSLVCAGMIDCPGTQDGSSLRSLIDKPPVCGNSFSPLTGALLTGFRLHTGPVLLIRYRAQILKAHVFSILTPITKPINRVLVNYFHLACLITATFFMLMFWGFLFFLQLPEQYRLMHIQPPKKKSKHKHKHHRPQDPLPQGMTQTTRTHKCKEHDMFSVQWQAFFFCDLTETPSDSDPKKKKKKRDDDPDRKKKKKDKKKKKVRRSFKTPKNSQSLRFDVITDPSADVGENENLSKTLLLAFTKSKLFLFMILKRVHDTKHNHMLKSFKFWAHLMQFTSRKWNSFIYIYI